MPASVSNSPGQGAHQHRPDRTSYCITARPICDVVFVSIPPALSSHTPCTWILPQRDSLRGIPHFPGFLDTFMSSYRPHMILIRALHPPLRTPRRRSHWVELNRALAFECARCPTSRSLCLKLLPRPCRSIQYIHVKNRRYDSMQNWRIKSTLNVSDSDQWQHEGKVYTSGRIPLMIPANL